LSLLTVILGHTLLCLPYTIAILTTAFNALDQSLEEAAYDLGETRFGAFRLVILPMVMPGIISSLLMSFTVSLDEFIIAFFLAGAQPTLPTYIFSQLRFPSSVPVIMALGTMLVALSVVLLALAEFFRRRGAARTGQNNSGGLL
ncbi:MAG: ABC transporter permease subunit, partial [Paracoccus sp. (in: a-proteobacteria)]|nr:ABC transporter permease subunit [Paracoccus sp. (in: a-proteobacteria)]